MDAITALSLLLSLGTGSPVFPAGSGTFYDVFGETSESAWRFGEISASVNAFGGVAPGPCTATCSFSFSTTPTRFAPAFTSEYSVIPVRLDFFGSTVTSTARCPGFATCPPDALGFRTDFGPVPITLSALIRFRSLRDPGAADVFFSIIGRGTAFAYNEVTRGGGWPWSSVVRYDFTFDVVPEPSSAVMVVSGVAMLVVTRSVRRRRDRRLRAGGRAA
jgi:hypothetical protein